ncbi:hypothetical protein HMN09_00031300 [Mycena chlorophos]|uniref:DUF6533 domain-containing protein n=1 Tax=Mycena chlorophos TaxID=658473 RepID=A0A8H6TP39_MYCCL|nr:hypothetical protein HMN09_00031300 [Mycena chlorophos]
MPGPASEAPLSEFPPDQAIPNVYSGFVSNYINYAIATVLVYELFTSLDDEVAHVWPLKWRLPKFLFFLNRYIIRVMLVGLWILADFPGTSPEFCRVFSYWEMIPLRLSILAAQALVVIRVWAIYNNSREMMYLLSFLYGAEFLAVAASVIVATSDTIGVAQPYPLSCGLQSQSGYLLEHYASATWIAPVVFEFVMVLITLFKLVPRWSWRHPKCSSHPAVFGSGGNATVDVLARDSFIYFLFIFTFSLINAVLYEESVTAYYHTVLLGPTSAISCIAVSRMMINIRSVPGASKAGDDEDMSLSGSYLRSANNQTSAPYGKYPYRTSKIPGPGSTPDLPVHDLAFSETYGGGGLGLGNLPPEPEEEEMVPNSANPLLPLALSRNRSPRSQDIAYPPTPKTRSRAGSYATQPKRRSTDRPGTGSTLVASPPHSPIGLPQTNSPPMSPSTSGPGPSMSYFGGGGGGAEPLASSSSPLQSPFTTRGASASTIRCAHRSRGRSCTVRIRVHAARRRAVRVREWVRGGVEVR